MPIITFEGPKLTKEQKKELIKSFTESASEVIGMSEKKFTVMLKETKSENVGVGGELLSEKKKD